MSYLIKVFNIYFIVSKCSIFIELAMQGGKNLKIRGVGGPFHGRHPLGLDNIGKKCRMPFVYALQ